MSARSQDSSQSVSLFPFLAVLVCAMGALILLLLVITRKIRDDVAARQIQEAQQTVATVPDEGLPVESASEFLSVPATFEDMAPPPMNFDREVTAPEVAIQQEDLLSVESPPMPIPATGTIDDTPPPPLEVIEEDDLARLDRELARLESQLNIKNEKLNIAQKELAEKRTRLTSDKQALASLREERGKWREELRKLDANSVDVKQQTETLNEQLASLARDQEKLGQDQAAKRLLLEKAVETLGKKQEESANRTSEYRLIPYDGRSGTYRRPIYIECTSEGLKYVPENVLLTEDDFERASVLANPLLGTAMAVARYWFQKDLVDKNRFSGDAPYVLLLVRPDGIPAYYAARTLLKSSRVELGYELIGTETPITYPDLDPGAKQALEKALQEYRNAATPRELVFEPGRSGTGRGTDDASPNGLGGPAPKPFPEVEGMQPLGPPPLGPSSIGRDAKQLPGRLANDPSLKGSGLPSRPSEKNPFRNQASINGRASQSEETRLESSPQGSSPNEGSPSNPFSGRTRPRTTTPQSDFAQRLSSGGRASPGQLSPGQLSPGQLSPGRQAPGRQAPGQQAPGQQAPAWSSAGQSASNQAAPNQSASSQSASRAEVSSSLARKLAALQMRNTIGYQRKIVARFMVDRIVIEELGLAIRAGDGESSDELQANLLRAVSRAVDAWGAPPQGFHWTPELSCVLSPGGNAHYLRVEEAFQEAGLKASTRWSLDAPALSTFPEFRSRDRTR